VPADTETRENPKPKESASITLNRTQPSRETDGAQPIAVAQLPVTRNDNLLAVRSLVPSTPSDFELGSLYPGSGSGDAQAIVRVADTFFQGLGNHTVVRNAVEPESLTDLTRSLRPFLESDLRVVAARYATPQIDDGLTGQVRVRIFSETGQTNGILILGFSDNHWQVVDLQADLMQLGVPVPKRTEPFEPSVGVRLGDT